MWIFMAVSFWFAWQGTRAPETTKNLIGIALFVTIGMVFFCTGVILAG
jgi:hypothetical protein